MAQLEEEYPKDLQVVYRHYPLISIHDKAALAAQAAEAAGLQGKFWELHEVLYATSSEWAGKSVDEFKQWVIDQAEKLGLDVEKFTTDLESEAIAKIAQQAYDHNSSIGMPGTPFLVINNQPYQGQLSFSNLDAIIQASLLEKRHFTDCPPMVIDRDKKYFATLKTDKGDVKLELFADKAPLAVNSFVFLANNGWFDGVTFHRVIPGFVAQAGDPSGSGFGGPGYTFENETSADLKFDAPGVLGMANAGPGTNGSQFFITFAPTPNLDGGYTIFGRVVEGMDVLEKLTPRDPSQSMNLPPGDKILQVIIEEQ